MQSKDKPKRLIVLINEVTEQLPQLEQPMKYLRSKGNEAVHPKETEDSEQWLASQQEVARNCVEYLTAIVEELYLPQET